MWAKILQTLATVLITNIVVPLAKLIAVAIQEGIGRSKRKERQDKQVDGVKNAQSEADRIKSFDNLD